MASINGVSGSNYTSSLYNSANIISGLASGLDTEGMIENLVKSYQNKIQTLNNQTTKIGWKQEAYQGIIAKMASFSSKYTSYTSGTNLMSASFFNSAVKYLTKGENSSKISATGRTDSDVRVDSVKTLATAARYAASGALAKKDNSQTITAANTGSWADGAAGLDLANDKINLGTLNGSLTLTYGNKTVSVSFDEVADQGKITGTTAQEKAESLAKLINEKLADQDITFSNGTTQSADSCIKITADQYGKLTFEDATSAKNGVYISGASGSVGDVLNLGNLDNASQTKPNTISINSATQFDTQKDAYEYLSGKSFNINLDGTTKTINMPKIEKVKGEDGSDQYKFTTADMVKDKYGQTRLVYGFNDLDEEVKKNYTLVKAGSTETVSEDKLAETYTKKLQEGLQAAFGDKVTVKNSDAAAADNKLGLEFSVKNKGSSLLINTSVGEALGIGKTATNYLNTSDTLEKLVGKDNVDFNNLFKDEGAKQDLIINGVTIGSYGKDAKLSDIMNDINSSEAGVRVSYSKTTGQFVFSSKETGSENKIEINGGLAGTLFGSTIGDDGNVISSADYKAGTDAEFTVTINGTTQTMTRGSNSVDIDGMTITFKDTFNEDYDHTDPASKAPEGVTFERSTDSDKIVDAIKSMVTDYNDMMKAIRSAYATMPAKNSSGALSSYEPLTDEDKASMSESAIANYEEKAKQGLLFGDSNLSNLYQRMREVFSPTGADSATLSKMGITIGYDGTDGSSYLALDENKLREMLDSDPDAVQDIFTRTASSGGTDGLMQGLKTQLDRYAGLDGAVKGILVQQAGTPLRSNTLLSNEWQKQIDRINTDIEKWQDKLSSQVDRYTSMFSRLELLINQMNSQSSTLAGLMGG